MAAVRIPAARASAWLLQRKLNRRTPAGMITTAAKILLIRVCAAACAFGSMVFTSWIAAFARALLGHGWSHFRTLGGAALSGASTQAGIYQGDLIPVFVVWAAFLLLVPIGYTLAFRSAVVAAGTLGALDFSTPSFFITSEAARFNRAVAQFTHSWNGILLFIASAAAAYLLHHYAVGLFGRLDQLSGGRTRAPILTAPWQVYAGQASGFVLALIVLLTATWSGTVVWLAATHAHGNPASYGLMGVQAQGDYLVILVIVAVFVAHCWSAERWLLAGMMLAAVAGAIASVSSVPRDLAFRFGQGELARISSAWGGGSVWATLFVGFPACLLGVYLVARIWLLGQRLV